MNKTATAGKLNKKVLKENSFKKLIFAEKNIFKSWRTRGLGRTGKKTEGRFWRQSDSS